MTLTFDLWHCKSIGFQILLRTKYVPSLVKIHWRPLILECSQGCYREKIIPCDLDHYPMTLTIALWPWKSIGFQILLRTKSVTSLVKIHWRMLILECSQGCYRRKEDGRTVALLYLVLAGWKWCHYKGHNWQNPTYGSAQELWNFSLHNQGWRGLRHVIILGFSEDAVRFNSCCAEWIKHSTSPKNKT